MTLRTSELGRTLIKAFEARKLKVYKCSAGKWTIGYGHTTAAGGDLLPVVNASTKPITAAFAETLFLDDIDRFENRVEALVKGIELTVCQFDALVSFAFNAGVEALRTSTLLKKVKALDWEAAEREFLKWNKFTNPETGKKEVSKGLDRRRRAEAALWRGDLEDAETYGQLDFPDMPQAVEPPAPPKTMAQSKSGNASIVGGVTTAVLGGKAVIDQVQEVVAPVQQVAQAAQAVTASVHATAQSGQQAVQQTQGAVEVTTQTVAPLVQAVAANPGTTLPHILPWLLLMLVALAAFGYVWHDRRKKLHEEGV